MNSQDPPANNAFGFTANARSSPPSRVATKPQPQTRTAADDYTRTRINPDTTSPPPGAKPTKTVTPGPRSAERGPMSGMEAALAAHADKIHPTGKLKPGEQSRG